MTSILFLLETISCNCLRWNYPRNKKHFLNFFARFRNLDSVLKIFDKKVTLIADVFFKLRTPKNVIR